MITIMIFNYLGKNWHMLFTMCPVAIYLYIYIYLFAFWCTGTNLKIFFSILIELVEGTSDFKIICDNFALD